MPFFFSYKTFARSSTGAAVFSSNAVPGEAITSLLTFSSDFEFLGARRRGGLGANGVRPEAFASHEGTQASDGLAEDQILHLISAFVGVERFAIRKEPRDLVVGDDTVAAEQLASPGDGLAALGRAERLGKGRVGVRQFAFGVQLRLAHDQALRGRYVGNHLSEQVLHQLERADGLAELHALLRVFERGLISAHRASSGHPRHGVACHLQHLRGVAERVAALEAVRFRNPNVLQRDVAVLDDLQRNLVLDLFDTEARRRLVLDDEALDLVVGDIARPDNRDVAPGSVADPPLLAVEDPAVALALSRGQHATAYTRAHQWLGQAETADLLEARHRRKPLLLLLFRSVDINGAHRQAAVHAVES